jgi:hemolysin activation/secretion protein
MPPGGSFSDFCQLFMRNLRLFFSRLPGRLFDHQSDRPGRWLRMILTFPFTTGLALSAAPAPETLFISEYRVHGAHGLTRLEIETAVYPYLGPGRTEEDVKAACQALEKAYRAKGFGAVSVQYDPQVGEVGVVHLRVSEGRVARLRVTGARYFSPEKIKAEAPSLAEGNVINFNAVSRDMVALNQLRDRTVTPSLQPGSEPGTFNIDLSVKDSPPVHASAELNNYNSPNTTPLRAIAAVSDTNLAQSGQGAGVSFELAPERRTDAEVLSAYYLAHFSGLDRLSLLLQGTKQNSDISTLGGSTVAGPGQTLELEAILALPNGTDWSTGKEWSNFTHSFSLGLNYKHYQQTLKTGSASSTGAGTIVTPITYYPLTATYSATLTGLGGKGSVTEFSAGTTFNFRGMGSSPEVFDLNRYGADASFITFKADFSHTQDLPAGLQIFGRIQGQIANEPLVSSEEMSGGGQQTVRGYLESETVGDNGEFASLELRGPSVLKWLGRKDGDWRFFVFGDAGRLTLLQPLPDQQSEFSLASVGIGTRLVLGDHLSGSCDAADPLDGQAYTKAHDIRVNFRVGLDY